MPLIACFNKRSQLFFFWNNSIGGKIKYLATFGMHLEPFKGQKVFKGEEMHLLQSNRTPQNYVLPLSVSLAVAYVSEQKKSRCLCRNGINVNEGTKYTDVLKSILNLCFYFNPFPLILLLIYGIFWGIKGDFRVGGEKIGERGPCMDL